MKKCLALILIAALCVWSVTAALADMVLDSVGVFGFSIGIDGNFDFTVQSGVDRSYGEAYLECFCGEQEHDIQTTYQIEEAAGCPFEMTLEKTQRRENETASRLTDAFDIVCTPLEQPLTAGYYPFTIRITASCGVEIGWAECELELYVSSDPADFTWTASDSAVTITGYVGQAAKAALPRRIADLPVTAIGTEAFYSCEAEIESVYLPDTIASIGEDAFYGCESLREIRLPANIREIGSYAFAECKSLESVDIPASITTISRGMFNACTNLRQVSFSPALRKIEAAAFGGCKSLTQLVLPSFVTSLGDNAFNSCSALTSVSVPDSLVSIGNGTFSGCSALEEIALPDTLSQIGSNAFYGCSSLRRMELPASLSVISEMAFMGCHALTEMEIPANVGQISRYAMSSCSSLESVVLQEGVAQIKEHAFGGCEKLRSITLPESLTYISPMALEHSFDVTARVFRNSYAHTWCEENAVPYTFIGEETTPAPEITPAPETTPTPLPDEDDTLLWFDIISALDRTGSFADRGVTASLEDGRAVVSGGTIRDVEIAAWMPETISSVEIDDAVLTGEIISVNVSDGREIALTLGGGVDNQTEEGIEASVSSGGKATIVNRAPAESIHVVVNADSEMSVSNYGAINGMIEGVSRGLLDVANHGDVLGAINVCPSTDGVLHIFNDGEVKSFQTFAVGDSTAIVSNDGNVSGLFVAASEDQGVMEATNTGTIAGLVVEASGNGRTTFTNHGIVTNEAGLNIDKNTYVMIDETGSVVMDGTGTIRPGAILLDYLTDERIDETPAESIQVQIALNGTYGSADEARSDAIQAFSSHVSLNLSGIEAHEGKDQIIAIVFYNDPDGNQQRCLIGQEALYAEDEPTPEPYYGNSKDEVLKAIGYSPEDVYRAGDSGPAVMFIQTALKELVGYEGEITESFGYKTEASVKKFQQQHGMTQTGVCDAETMDKLIDAYVGGVPKEYGRNFYNPEWYGAQDWLREIGLKQGEVILLSDLRTDTTFRIKVQSMGDHIDAEPLTASDTRALCRVYGVSSAEEIESRNLYERRPMLLTVACGEAEYQIVCSLYGVPHGASTITDNRYDGVFCLHLTGSKMHGRDEVSPEHAAAISEAMEIMRGIVEKQLTVSGQKTLKLPGSLKSIDSEAFAGIAADEVVISDGCMSIGSRAFAGCENLVRVVIPNSVAEIAEDAFEGCSTLIIAAPRGSAAQQYALSRCMIWENTTE